VNRSNPGILNKLFNKDYSDQYFIVTDFETLNRLKPILWSASTGGAFHLFPKKNNHG
jgi:hypothetical protein